MSDFFDLGPTLGRHDQDRSAGRSVNDHARVQFLSDVQPGFDQQRVDLLAFFAGLNGDQRVAQHQLGIFASFVGRPHQHDTRLIRMLFEATFAASAGVNLCFDDGQLAAEFFKRRCCFVGRFGDDSVRDGDASGLQQFFSLIFVNFHRDLSARIKLLPQVSRELTTQVSNISLTVAAQR